MSTILLVYPILHLNFVLVPRYIDVYFHSHPCPFRLKKVTIGLKTQLCVGYLTGVLMDFVPSVSFSNNKSMTKELIKGRGYLEIEKKFRYKIGHTSKKSRHLCTLFLTYNDHCFFNISTMYLPIN